MDKDKKNRRVVLFLTILLALFLQTYNLGYKSLWLDEVTSLRVSELDVSALLACPDPSHPPLYYIVLHFFLYLGNGETVLRMPSVIFALMTVPMAYVAGKKFFGVKEGLIAALLLSFSPIFVQYAQEARMYTLFTFLSLLSLYFFYSATRKKDDRLWAGYALSTFFDVYTHYFAFLVILTEAAYAVFFLRGKKEQLKKFILSLAVVLVVSLPLIANLYTGAVMKIGEGPSWGAEPTASFLPYILNELSGGKVALILFIPIVLYGLFKSGKSRREETSLLLMWVILPLIAAFLLAFRISIVSKYLIFVLPVYLILVSAGICSLKNKQLMALLVVVILALDVYYLLKYYDTQKEDWRSAAGYLKTNALSDETVLVFPDYTGRCLVYYGIDPGRITGLPERDVSLEGIKEIYDQYGKLWVLYSRHSSVYDPQDLIGTWLDKTCVKEEEVTAISIYSCEFNL